MHSRPLRWIIGAIAAFVLPASLSALSPETKSEVGACIKDLAADSFGVRQAAMQRLAEFSSHASPDLATAAESTDLETTQRIVDVLKQAVRKRGAVDQEAARKALSQLAACNQPMPSRLAKEALADLDWMKSPNVVTALELMKRQQQLMNQIGLRNRGLNLNRVPNQWQNALPGQFQFLPGPGRAPVPAQMPPQQAWQPGMGGRRVTVSNANGAIRLVGSDAVSQVTIQVDPNGPVTVKVLRVVNGQKVELSVEAKNADELKQKSAEAHAAYLKYAEHLDMKPVAFPRVWLPAAPQLPAPGVPGQPFFPQPGNVMPGIPVPGNLPPGNLPPGNLPPGNLPPGNLPPGNAIPANANLQIPVGPGVQVAVDFAQRRVTVTESSSDPRVTITKEHNGQLRLELTRKVDGKDKTEVYAADNAAELEARHPEAGQVYDRYVSRLRVAESPFQSREKLLEDKRKTRDSILASLKKNLELAKTPTHTEVLRRNMERIREHLDREIAALEK